MNPAGAEHSRVTDPWPYGGQDAGQPRQSRLSAAIHIGAWILATGWFIVETSQSSEGTTIPAVLWFSTLFLLIAPLIITKWEFEFRHFEDGLRTAPNAGYDAAQRAMSTIITLRHLIVTGPVLIICVAYLAIDDSIAEQLALPVGGITKLVALLIFALGGFVSGWGLLSALMTLAISRGLTEHRTEYDPFAGSTSKASDDLASFSFRSALMYGACGALLMPGLSAAAWVADGTARVALFVAILLIVGMTATLIVVPAYRLSSQLTQERSRYLDELSGQINGLEQKALATDQSFAGKDYRRLHALLELRSHAVSHSVKQPSLELVKRVPAAVLLPMASVTASWLSLVVS